MLLFNKKKRAELKESRKKLNKLWEMYDSGELVESDYNTFVLCDYASGVNSEGHSGWFLNTENTEGKETLIKYISTLKELLPKHLYDNLERAFLSYNTEKEYDVCESADDYYYNNDREIIEYIQEIAKRLEP